MKKILSTCFFVLLATSLFFPALAAETAKKTKWQAAFEQAVKEVGVEQAVAEAIASGMNGGECVKAVIEMGYNPYSVVKAAVVAGGDLGNIVEVAHDFGISTAVISKAAVDAGAEIMGVAQAQTDDTGFAYTPPPETTPDTDQDFVYAPLAAEEVDAAPEAEVEIMEPLVTTEDPSEPISGPTELIGDILAGGGSSTEPVFVSPSIP